MKHFQIHEDFSMFRSSIERPVLEHPGDLYPLINVELISIPFSSNLAQTRPCKIFSNQIHLHILVSLNMLILVLNLTHARHRENKMYFLIVELVYIIKKRNES